MKKRAQPTRAEIEACKRAFWEVSALQTLDRARRRIRNGGVIDKTDRAYIAQVLEGLFNREYQRVNAMKPVKLRAYLADYVQEKMRITLDEAAAAVAGDVSAGAVRRALIRLRAARRKSKK